MVLHRVTKKIASHLKIMETHIDKKLALKDRYRFLLQQRCVHVDIFAYITIIYDSVLGANFA